eukprot:g1.t1
MKSSRFVPSALAAVEDFGWKCSQLAEFMSYHRPKVAVITGAGISTSSGIPCYRGDLGSYSRGHVPLQHHEFVDSSSKRKRYWARSLRGFKYFHERPPSLTHRFLAEKLSSFISGIVTQNVDRLHHVAGSKNIVELHGRGDRVFCLSCNKVESRKLYTERTMDENREWISRNDLKIYREGNESEDDDIRADGDAHIAGKDFEQFVVPPCKHCDEGVVMPDLVFFGGSIRKEVKLAAQKIVDEADALLVLGSSCSTYSAFSLVRRAHGDGKPIAMVNIGETRIDDLIDEGMKFQYPIDDFLE